MPSSGGDSAGATLREMVYLEGMPLSAINRQVTPVAAYVVHAQVPQVRERHTKYRN